MDDAVSIILKSGKDQEIEEMILSTLFNINISQRYGTFMRKVKNTILGNITEKEDQQRRAINNLFRAPDVLSRIKRNKELKMPDAIIEDERKNIHPFVQQYNLTSEIIFKDDTSNLKKKIDDYYANFLVCREYSPITVKALSDDSHDPVVRERVMLCINFVREALLLKEKRDFK